MAERLAVGIDEFWMIIGSARASTLSNGDARNMSFVGTLVEQLSGWSQAEILEYEERFEEVHSAVYRWDVWAVAYLIGGGCSDDSFMDFRAGLIVLGRDWYREQPSARTASLNIPL